MAMWLCNLPDLNAWISLAMCRPMEWVQALGILMNRHCDKTVMKNRGKVTGAEIREQGLEGEGKVINMDKMKTTGRGFMESLGSSKELQSSGRKLGGLRVQF